MYSGIFILGLFAFSAFAQDFPFKAEICTIEREFAPGEENGPIYDATEQACITENYLDTSKFDSSGPRNPRYQYEWNCYVACVLKKRGAMTENGTLSMPPDEPSIYQDCYNERQAGNHCETAIGLMRCLQIKHGVHRMFLLDTRIWRVKPSVNPGRVLPGLIPAYSERAIECKEETGSNPFESGLSLNAIKDDIRFNCYAACVLKKSGLIGENDPSNVTNQTSSAAMESYVPMKAREPTLLECYKQTGINDCDTAINIVNCLGVENFFHSFIESDADHQRHELWSAIGINLSTLQKPSDDSEQSEIKSD